MKQRALRRMLWSMAIGVAGLVIPAGGTAAQAVPGPVAITPIVAEAGYFLAEGVCPARTATIWYKWTNASNRNGWGLVAVAPGAFSVKLRMLASAPGATISVTLRCLKANGHDYTSLGPVKVVSGVDLLPLPADSGSGRRIVYSLSAQQIWVLEADETVVKSHLVSGRRLAIARGKSQLGTFAIFARAGARCGGGCAYWLSFHRGYNDVIALHQIPFTRQGPYQSNSELGQPRSHGCVRQSKADAAWLYAWAVVGDAVVVVP